MIGRIAAINISEKKGAPRRTIEEAMFEVGHGLAGDIHAGNGHRQVSFFGIESRERVKALGMKGLCTERFVENLTTEGIELWKLSVGTKLKIGDTIQEVTQIGKQCFIECAIFKQAGSCAMATEAIFTKVLQEGKIKVGDLISIIE